MERLSGYLNHHVKIADVAARSSRGMTPEENAQDLVEGWILGNKYPKTDEFIQAIADLIRIRENGDDIEIIPDNPEGEEPPDPICWACKKCERKFK